ncbi:MAG: hypothetical protein LC662_14470, partial [Rhodothermaceae bacterium]|nr:hypothetical protein [Rhodothermaceae bacterium]
MKNHKMNPMKHWKKGINKNRDDLGAGTVSTDVSANKLRMATALVILIAIQAAPALTGGPATAMAQSHAATDSESPSIPTTTLPIPTKTTI